jgi:hypothetical protein
VTDHVPALALIISGSTRKHYSSARPEVLAPGQADFETVGGRIGGVAPSPALPRGLVVGPRLYGWSGMCKIFMI